MYTSTLPSASTLDVVSGQRHATAAKPPIKTRYPLYRRLDGPHGLSLWVRKISPLPAFDPLTFLPVASRYSSEQYWCNNTDTHPIRRTSLHKRSAVRIERSPHGTQETNTWTWTTTAGFEPAISASERPQTDTILCLKYKDVRITRAQNYPN
jgi:hypothetical protein